MLGLIIKEDATKESYEDPVSIGPGTGITIDMSSISPGIEFTINATIAHFCAQFFTSVIFDKIFSFATFVAKLTEPKIKPFYIMVKFFQAEEKGKCL